MHGQTGVDPAHDTGTYVDPKDWNALISRNDVMVIDTRNDYEIRIGRFRHAVDPETSSSVPSRLADALAENPAKPKAGHRTGGIYSSAYMKQIGFEESIT